MVDTALIKDTINELLEANVDKDTIYQTLRDIGVDIEDIDKYYKEAMSKETSEPKEEQETKPDLPEKEESQENVRVSPRPVEKTRKEEAIRPKPNTTTEELEKATIEVANSSIIRTEGNTESESISLDFTPKLAEINDTNLEIKKQINDLENQISDIKAQINGLTKIMKDILEENRNILNRLK